MQKSIDGVDYEIRKIKVGGMLPILPLFESQPSEAQRQMVSVCVAVDGEALGDLVNDLEWGVYSELSKDVLAMNGFPVDEVKK